MRKVLKVIGFISVTFILFVIVSAVAIYQLIRTGEFRRFLIDEIEKQTELKVDLGEADLQIGWITGIAFGNLGLSEPGAVKPAITAERITARVALTPLIHRQVIVYEIRLQKPTAKFTRDKEGRIPLLDRLLNLPFLKQQDQQFSLDLRRVRIQNGVIEFADQRVQGRLGDWRLVSANGALERVRGQRLRGFMKELLKRPSPEPAGAALEFNLRGGLLKNGAAMNLRANGRLLFPQETLQFNEARWTADVEVVNFPASLVKDYVGARMPIRSVAGRLAQRVHFEGNPARQLKLKGELEFKQLALDAPDIFLAPLAKADGKISYDIDWTRQRLQVVRADFRTGEVRFSLRGEVGALDGDDPHLRLDISALSAPLTAVRRYLPLKIIESPRVEAAANSIRSGQLEVKRAGVDVTLAGLGRLTQSGAVKQLWLEAELRDVAGSLGIDGSLPLRGVSGRVSLVGGVLKVQNLKGVYGDSVLTSVDGSYDLNPGAGGRSEAHVIGDINLAELRAQVRSGFFSKRATKFAASVQELAGRGRVDLDLRVAANTAMEFRAKLALDDARARYDGYSLNQLNGEIALTPTEIKGDNLRAQLSGSPIQFRFVLSDYAGDDGAFDLALSSPGVKAGLVTSLLLESGSLQDPGVVRGALRYSGAMNNKTRRKFTGNLELVNVQVTVHPLLQPLRELNGRIGIDEKGVDLQNLRAILAGFPAGASARWRFTEKPQLLFDFTAPNLDVTYLISQIDPEVGEFYNTLEAEGKITLAKGRIKNFEFSELKTDAIVDHRVWHLTNLTARSAEGKIVGVTTIVDRPDTLGINAEPRIQGVPIQAFFKWFDITNTEMTGRVNITGKLETVGKNDLERKQNLNGAFQLRIEEGTINRMRTLVQILNLLDLSRWFTLQLPDLTKQGIRFRAITGNFKVNQGVYSTENLLVDSDDLRMTGAGKIDMPKDQIEFLVAVRPFAGIDTVITKIPLLGRGIAAIKNSFMVASFNINGKIDDPTITPAPLGTLSEMFWSVLGLPKNIIGLGEGEKKDPPKEPAKTPAK